MTATSKPLNAFASFSAPPNAWVNRLLNLWTQKTNGNGSTRCFIFTGTPPKANMKPENGPVEKGQLFSKAPFLRFQFHLSFQKCISLGSPIVSTKIKPLSLHLGGKSSLIGFPWASRHLCWHCNAWILGLMRIFDGSKFLGILQGCCRLFTLPETNTVRP